MTSNVIPSTPLDRPASVEKHTPPILLSYSPKGSQQWIRKIEEEFTPRVGMEFNTLEDGIQFYRIYAITCGFDIRKSSQRRFRDETIRTKHIVCHREGFGESKKIKNLVNTKTDETPKKKERVTTIRRFGCRAMIQLMFQLGKYVICQFREGHNHPLVLEVANGYENVGATLLDFKNFQREVKLFIGDQDAQMFINHLQNLVETEQGFYFSYDVYDSQNLCRVFWSDAESRRNYSLFGDAVSFDPTYGTNKYCMVFTPFTGVDHHNRSFTFAATLLSHKDEQSFTWVFQKFLDAMGQREPQCIITDQDPAIKNALPVVFKQAMHRFCMWHIMTLIWNLGSLNKSGIPAYYRDIFMWCLLRTTQRSESENSLCERFENKHGTLVEFWLRFQSAMDQQRHNQRSFDRDNVHSLPQLATPLWFKAHASNVYTNIVFYDFQSEIKSYLCSCSVGGFILDNNLELFDIVDASVGKTYRVVYNGVNSDVECSCKLFERKGILWRHIVWVPLYDLHGQLIDDFYATDLRKKDMCSLWSKFYATIGVPKTLPTNHITELGDTLKAFTVKLKPQVEPLTKEQELEMLLGCRSAKEVNILPPSHSKNKGSGKRMTSAK
ncbi:hypothetical protein RND81_02G176800 [Saponaria officinalis]|uniref:SWIM-type domain-containing protein n=1 Tax=Saponaria officinalis TaxID=3572 RepID=A0AAW1MMY6_SAPOF